ncbi:MAG TPA: hypothetical protein VFK13_08290 [Gemmatimonadaceae bacterium]|nr:hypothetical protein [Gemmatimonadaceae bacterium]
MHHWFTALQRTTPERFGDSAIVTLPGAGQGGVCMVSGAASDAPVG